jgi:adenine deaminase
MTAQTRAGVAARIDQALGDVPADLVIRNARVLDLTGGAAPGETVPGDVAICGDRIVGISDSYRGVREIDAGGRFVVPGFIDSHLHCESTLVTPLEFDRCVLPRGTTTVICDPHEICNVLGTEGLEYFLAAADRTILDLRVQLSSCVPATHLETAGATLTAADLVRYRDNPHVIGLAEFMNFPGLLAKDPDCLDKIAAFDGAHIDGHAPLLSGKRLNAYLACGIRNCHETSSLAEGREKLAKGMQVLIRSGSVAKDIEALAPLISDFASPFLGFCTDDRNPLDIAEDGHMDYLVRRAIGLGAPVAATYRAASWSAARGFGLRDRGLVAPGYLADLLLLDDLETCGVAQVIRAGSRSLPRASPAARRSRFRAATPCGAAWFGPRISPSGPRGRVLRSSGFCAARSSPSGGRPICPIAMAFAMPTRSVICSRSRCWSGTARTAISGAASCRGSASAAARSPHPSGMTATISACSGTVTPTWQWRRTG